MEMDFRPTLKDRGIQCTICRGATLQFANLGKDDSVYLVACPVCGVVGHCCSQAYDLVVEGKLPGLPVTPFLGLNLKKATSK